MLNNLFGNIFFIVFFALFIIGAFFFYVLFYRGLMLKRDLKENFSDLSSARSEVEIYDSKSPYMRHEGGNVLESIKINEFSEVLIYQFLVSGQLNMKRYLVYVQANIPAQNALYGKGHVYRECKVHNLYKTFQPIKDVSQDINYLSDYIEAIEVFNGVAYSYYKLNSFLGCAPMLHVHELIKIEN